MKRNVFLYSGVITALVVCMPVWAATKEPNVSGAFYPADSKVLSSQIDGFFSGADVKPIDGRIVALISPHAGYVYSGPVAAYGYKALQQKYTTVVIIAASHYFGFSDVAVWPQGSFKTPLGEVAVDDVFSKALMAQTALVQAHPGAFEQEHSLEAQIPFLQKSLGASFTIVPLITGQINLKQCEELAAALAVVIGTRDDVLVVASTDLSHYHPYDTAVATDSETVSYIKRFDSTGLWNANVLKKAELCGVVPVVTTLSLAKRLGAGGIEVLHYANSGDTAGDKARVVGYASIAIYKPMQKDAAAQQGERDMLTKEQRQRLLTIARDSFETYVKTGKRTSVMADDPALNLKQGAFVTLTKHGDLRGCIGRLVADEPLYLVVRDMAVEAAVDDPRFPAVTRDEIKDIKVEISVLSPFERITDVNRIEVGKHGILMRRGFYSGLLLPQVATEYGWDRNTFLAHTCQKAGLPPDAWKDKATEISIFSAEVFSEQAH